MRRRQRQSESAYQCEGPPQCSLRVLKSSVKWSNPAGCKEALCGLLRRSGHAGLPAHVCSNEPLHARAQGTPAHRIPQHGYHNMKLASSVSALVQDAKKPFVAYFGAAGTLGRPRMHAWVSRSTHGLRERLRAEPHGLVFSTPLAPSADVRFRDERMQAELMEASQVGHAASLHEVHGLGSLTTQRVPSLFAL